MSRRRRRGAVLVALAIACGGMAASEVQSRESRLELRVGTMVPVVVARADLPAGTTVARERSMTRTPVGSLADAGWTAWIRSPLMRITWSRRTSPRSTSTRRPARMAVSSWAGRTRGTVTASAAASVGNVYEPYLEFTAHLNILNDRLLHGFTFAESAYSSIDVLSWMSVMVGDPLYRPYASWLQIETAADSSKKDSWKMYHDFAVQNFSNASAQYRFLARQAASRVHNCPMLEDLGLMEIGDGNLAAATSYFGEARTCYSNRDDILRVVIEEADAWSKLKKPKRGIDLLRSTLRVASDAPAAPLLRNLEQELRGLSTTPTPRPTPRSR